MLELLDSAVSERVIVFGAVPPEGRDFDLLVHPAEERSIGAALSAVGFVGWGHQWVRLRTYAADEVDLVPVSHWQLPEHRVDALFAEGIPIEGLSHLVRPAPHHAILILARQLVEGGRLRDKHRLRVARMLELTPDAFERSREEAGAWNAERALDLLERMYRHGETRRALSARTDALVERLVATGVEPRRARMYAWRTQLLGRRRTRRRGRVVAISGLDGAGKTTQVHSLHTGLTLLRVDSAASWTRITTNTWIWILAHGVEKVLALASVGRRPETVTQGAQFHRTALRRRSPFVTEVWAGFVAFANGLSHRRAVGRHVRQGRVVICDRYVLDSAVHLRYRYGEHRRFRFQIWLIRALSPKPAKAFFLDVAPERAHARRYDEYNLDEFTRLARLYRNEYEEIGARRIDANRPLHEICGEIGREVWPTLRAP